MDGLADGWLAVSVLALVSGAFILRALGGRVLGLTLTRTGAKLSAKLVDVAARGRSVSVMAALRLVVGYG